MLAWGGVQTTSADFRQMMEISSRLVRFTSISFLWKEAIKMRPAHLSALLQLENSPACSISNLISNNHPMVMELRYLGPQGSESDRSDSWDCHSRSSPFHRRLQHITPAETNRLQISRVRHAAHGAHGAARGHSWIYVQLVASFVFFLIIFIC